MRSESRAKLSLLSAMLIFGTIGIFRTYIPLPSGVIAFSRGLIGMLFLLVVMVVKREKTDLAVLRKSFIPLSVSGMLIGVNWLFLFEAYRYTTVATATLCYYMAPLFVILASPIILKERFTVRKLVCILVAFAGMILVSGIVENPVSELSEMKGIFLGLAAAAFYASVVLLNKRIESVPAFPKTAIQLGFAALIILPYSLFAERVSETPSTTAWILLIAVGILHTGIAYTLYFGSMKRLSAQSVALFSYLDPIVAILLSLLFLREPMTLLSGVGAVLILGSTMISEWKQ